MPNTNPFCSLPRPLRSRSSTSAQASTDPTCTFLPTQSDYAGHLRAYASAAQWQVRTTYEVELRAYDAGLCEASALSFLSGHAECHAWVLGRAGEGSSEERQSAHLRLFLSRRIQSIDRQLAIPELSLYSTLHDTHFAAGLPSAQEDVQE